MVCNGTLYIALKSNDSIIDIPTLCSLNIKGIDDKS